jgi:hypothetical protein
MISKIFFQVIYNNVGTQTESPNVALKWVVPLETGRAFCYLGILYQSRGRVLFFVNL